VTQSTLVVLGAAGQLGQNLVALWPTAAISRDYQLYALNQQQLDISNAAAVNDVLGELRPSVIINAAAYTAVDAAETQQERAFAVNAKAVADLAQWTGDNQARLIHISTDFVFAGDQNQAYTEQHIPAPRNVYGNSKLRGESAILQQANETAVIIRASWLYSAYRKNFLKTMLQLMCVKNPLSVVSDQIGTPTSCNTLAEFIFDIVANPQASGIYHCSDAGLASWYDFAVAIFEEATAMDLLPLSTIQSSEQILAIGTAQYPTAAARPVFSVLDKTRSREELGFEPGHWRQALRRVLLQLKDQDWKPI